MPTATFGRGKKTQAATKPATHRKLDPAKIDARSKEALLPWRLEILYVDRSLQVVRYETLQFARDAAAFFDATPFVRRVKLLPPEN